MQAMYEILLTVCCVIVLEITNEQTNERLLSICYTIEELLSIQYVVNLRLPISKELCLIPEILLSLFIRVPKYLIEILVTKEVPQSNRVTF